MSTPQSPRDDQDVLELIELCGCQSWDEVVEWFEGMSLDEIEAECNRCWPHEDNREFAKRLYEEV